MIHKGFDFDRLGGFPLNQQRLEYMQAAYSELSGMLAAFVGGNAIVSGCIVAGSQVGDGWVIVNGQLLPFVEGGFRETIIVREIRTPLIFKNGQNENVQFERIAQFSTGANTIQWSSLKRLNSLVNISAHVDRKDNPHEVTKTDVKLGNIPNAITDDPTVSNSQILATSKMVGAAFVNKFPFSGSVILDKTKTYIEIKLTTDKLDITQYKLIVDLWQIDTRPANQSQVGQLQNDRITDLQFRKYGDTTATPGTYISVVYDNTNMSTNELYTYQVLYTLIKL